jgi:hypothetical protein
MKSTTILASLLVTVSNALPTELISRQQGSGTGPYPAVRLSPKLLSPEVGS